MQNCFGNAFSDNKFHPFSISGSKSLKLHNQIKNPWFLAIGRSRFCNCLRLYTYDTPIITVDLTIMVISAPDAERPERSGSHSRLLKCRAMDEKLS